jgi:hypothetical protein
MDGRKGPDGEVDLDVHREVDATVGAAVIGRRTFDLGVDPWGGTPWPGVPSFVVTHRTRQDLLGNNGGTFAFDGLEAAARRAKQAAGNKDVLVLGADVARQFAAGLDPRVLPRRARLDVAGPAAAETAPVPDRVRGQLGPIVAADRLRVATALGRTRNNPAMPGESIMADPPGPAASGTTSGWTMTVTTPPTLTPDWTR